MAIGNQDTYTYNNYIELPEVFTGGNVIIGNQATAGAKFKINDITGAQILAASVFSASKINGEQITEELPISSKRDKNELVRFGYRNPSSRLMGFLPPQIPIVDSVLAANFDFTVLDGLTLWMDASDSDSVILDGSNRVSEWRDKSGFGRHHIQTTSSRRPYYDVKRNGLFGIRHTSADSTHLDFDGDAVDMPIMGPPFTMIVVYRGRGSLNVPYGIFEPAANPSRGTTFLYRDDIDVDIEEEWNFDFIGNNSPVYQRLTHTDNYILNSMVVLVARAENETSRSLRVNGVQVNQSASAGAVVMDKTRKSSINAWWRGDSPTGSLFSDGDTFEILTFNSSLSDSIVTFIENKLDDKWRITF